MDYTWSQLNFSRDCEAAAEINRLYFWASGNEFIPTIHAVQTFIRSALPPGEAKTPTDCELLRWFERKVNLEPATVTNRMYRTGFDTCPLRVCSAIQYPGDPDIMGIGMLAGYFTEALLVVLYLAAFVAKIRLRLRWRVLDALLDTVEDFYVSSLLFNMSILIAGLKIVPGSSSAYVLLQSTLVAGLTLSVPLALWPIQNHNSGRGQFYSAWLALNILLAFIQVTLVVWSSLATGFVTRREVNCLGEVFQNSRAPSRYFIVLQAFLGITAFVLVWPIIVSALPRAWVVGLTKQTLVKRWMANRLVMQFPWRHAFSVYGLLNTWATLFSLVYIQRLVASRFSSSPDDARWSFGQVMALSTWLPVIISFVQNIVSEELVEYHKNKVFSRYGVHRPIPRDSEAEEVRDWPPRSMTA